MSYIFLATIILIFFLISAKIWTKKFQKFVGLYTEGKRVFEEYDFAVKQMV